MMFLVQLVYEKPLKCTLLKVTLMVYMLSQEATQWELAHQVKPLLATEASNVQMPVQFLVAPLSTRLPVNTPERQKRWYRYLSPCHP